YDGTIVDSGPVEDPRRCVGNDVVVGVGGAVRHLADQRVFREALVTPSEGHWIDGGVLVADDSPGRPAIAVGRELDVKVHGVRAEESDVDPMVTRIGDIGAHRIGPVLIVTD